MDRLTPRAWLIVGAAALAFVAVVAGLAYKYFGWGATRQFNELDFDSVRIQTVPVNGSVYMLVGLGGNITVQVGDDGVLLVDSQYDQTAGKNLAAIQALSGQPIKYILNTHGHIDHIGGNERLARAEGSSSQAGGRGGERAVVMAHRNVLLRLSAPEGGRRAALWPTDVYGFGERALHFNGESIRLMHQPAAHTDGDTFVHFQVSNVVSAGDIYTETHYPFIDQWSGGSFRGIVDGLAQLVDTVVNDDMPGTIVIPGHGALQSEEDVVAYYDMIITIRDRIREMIDLGLSLEEIHAARPTADFDSHYGHETGWWNTGDFVRAVTLELMGEAGD